MSKERSRSIREFNFDYLVERLVADLINKPRDQQAELLHGARTSLPATLLRDTSHSECAKMLADVVVREVEIRLDIHRDSETLQ